MKRRSLLAIAGGTLAASAGCLRRLSSDWAHGPPSVDAATVELAPGEETMATVRAENVESMSIGVNFRPGIERPEVTIGDEYLTPTPTNTEESIPPSWEWSPPRATVTHETPIRVASNVSPGTYEYRVGVSKGSNRVSDPIAVDVTA